MSHMRKSCLKKEGLAEEKTESHASTIPGSAGEKKVWFDEIWIKEYPRILGDHPSVSAGAPLSIGWNAIDESTIDVDMYEYCRQSERRPRKKMILSVRKRVNTLLDCGYSIDEIADATLEVERIKKERAASLKASGWANPWDLLNGTVETTGSLLKSADVLGVGTAVGVVGGAVVGGGVAVVGATGKAIGATARGTVQGVNTVVGVGSDVTMATGKMIVGSGKVVAGGVYKGASFVAAPVVATGKAVGKTTVGKAIAAPVKVVTKPVGKVVVGTVNTTGRALYGVVNMMVSPLAGGSSTTATTSDKQADENKKEGGEMFRRASM